MSSPIIRDLRIHQLTGLRYFAALLVFFSHLKWSDSNIVFARIFESGYVGVSFFFLLSGFVLSYSYGERISNGSLGFVKYILLRLARLTPLHFATATPFVLFAIYKSDFHIIKTTLNLLYLQSWIPNSSFYFSLNAPSWSLSNEIFFYVCFFPLIFFSSKTLLKLSVILLILIIVSAFFIELYFSDQKLFGNNTVAHWLFYIFPGFRLIEFIVGMFAYRAWRNNFRISDSLVIPSYILLIGSMSFAQYVPESFRMSLYFIPFITLFLYSHLMGDGFLVKFFSSRLLILLGNASFAFYLIHQPLIGVLNKALSDFNLSETSFLFVSLFVITIVSVVIYISYEKRTELFLKRWIDHRLG